MFHSDTTALDGCQCQHGGRLLSYACSFVGPRPCFAFERRSRATRTSQLSPRSIVDPAALCTKQSKNLRHETTPALLRIAPQECAFENFSRRSVSTSTQLLQQLDRVAAKQLHALSGAQAANLSPEQATEVRRDLLKEMQLLSSLRHPNLLLFLGVTIDSHSGGPLSIITE